MTTTRQQILEAFRARLTAIQTGRGFETDAGVGVLLSESAALGPDDPNEAIAILIGEDIPKFQGANVFITLPVHIAAVAKADLDEPWTAVERLLGDIKRAVELADRLLGGLLRQPIERGPTRVLPREMGATSIGAAIEYRASYVEGWGTP